MKRAIYIYDESLCGHHLMYYRLFIANLINKGEDIVALCTDPDRLRMSLAKDVGELEDKVQYVKVEKIVDSKYERYIPGISFLIKWCVLK